MNDVDYVIAALRKDKERGKWAAVEVSTGISQRTMYNIVSNKFLPSALTVNKLLAHYKPAKKGKK